jgi:hypothetical protein
MRTYGSCVWGNFVIQRVGMVIRLKPECETLVNNFVFSSGPLQRLLVFRLFNRYDFRSQDAPGSSGVL